MSNPQEPKWLVFYTKSRTEKKVYDYLQKFGFESFLPLHTVLRQWSDRKKKVEVPLFNSYIFVHEPESRIMDVLQVPGIVCNVRHNGKPAVMRQKEIDTIKRFLETGYLIESLPVEDLKKGDRVEVLDGPLRGMEGILTQEYNEEKFSVLVETIDQVLTVNIEKRVLKFISEGDPTTGEKFWKNH